MNQPKDYREMATDCVDHAAHTDRHDEAMEWIGLGVINALLAIADGPTGKSVQQSIDTLDGFERLAQVERYLGFLDKNPRDPNPSLIERVDAIDLAATMATRRLDQLDALLKVDSFADPLDEGDHRDRVDADGDLWVRNPGGCWHTSILRGECRALDHKWTLAYLNERYGPLAFAPDPLDEGDHRDRMDRHGDIWQRVHEGCWMEPGFPPVSHGPAQCLQLAALPGPLIFAPDAEEAPQDAAGATQSDEQPEQAPDTTPEAADAAEAILCPECGHEIDSHGWDEDYALTCCHECDGPDGCRKAPSGIARELIDRAGGAK